MANPANKVIKFCRKRVSSGLLLLQSILILNLSKQYATFKLGVPYFAILALYVVVKKNSQNNFELENLKFFNMEWYHIFLGSDFSQNITSKKSIKKIHFKF